MATGPEGGTYLAIRQPDGTELLAREVGTRRRTWHERLELATGAWVEDRSLAAWFDGRRPGARGLSLEQALGLAGGHGLEAPAPSERPGSRLLGGDRPVLRSALAVVLVTVVVVAGLAGRGSAAPGEAASAGEVLWFALPSLVLGLLALLGSWPVLGLGLAGLLAYVTFDYAANAHPADETFWDALGLFLAPFVIGALLAAVGAVELTVRIVGLGVLWSRVRPRLSRRAGGGSA